MRPGGLGADDDPPAVDDPAGGRVVDSALLRLTDDQRAAEAIDTRRREHSLRLQAAESGSFAGVLTDLAERAETVLVSTMTGRHLSGTIATLGLDHLMLQTPAGERSLVPIAAVVAVRSTPDGTATVGDRDGPGARTLAAVLADLAVDRPRVVAHLRGGEAVAGRLWSVGQDLIAVRATDGSTAYVATAAIGDVLVT